jgi:hypothetical protein
MRWVGILALLISFGIVIGLLISFSFMIFITVGELIGLLYLAMPFSAFSAGVTVSADELRLPEFDFVRLTTFSNFRLVQGFVLVTIRQLWQGFSLYTAFLPLSVLLLACAVVTRTSCLHTISISSCQFQLAPDAFLAALPLSIPMMCIVWMAGILGAIIGVGCGVIFRFKWLAQMIGFPVILLIEAIFLLLVLQLLGIERNQFVLIRLYLIWLVVISILTYAVLRSATRVVRSTYFIAH